MLGVSESRIAIPEMDKYVSAYGKSHAVTYSHSLTCIPIQIYKSLTSAHRYTHHTYLLQKYISLTWIHYYTNINRSFYHHRIRAAGSSSPILTYIKFRNYIYTRLHLIHLDKRFIVYSSVLRYKYERFGLYPEIKTKLVRSISAIKQIK